MKPEISRTIIPVKIPDVLNKIGRVNIAPPIIELTRVKMVLQEGFNLCSYIYLN